MSIITYSATSPYSKTAQYSWRMGRYVHQSIPAAPDDTPMTVGSSYIARPDKLSNDMYGTPAFWWVFMVRNMNVMRDPIWDLKAGITIMIPSRAYLESLFGS